MFYENELYLTYKTFAYSSLSSRAVSIQPSRGYLFLGQLSTPKYLWYRVILSMLKVLSKQFPNKKRTSIQMIICIQWELSQYLPMKTLDFLQLNGLVAFVVF